MYRSFFCRLCRKKGVKVVHSEPSKQQQIFSTFNLHKYFGVFPSPKLSQLPFPFRSSAAVRRNGTKSCRRRVGGFINYVMRHLEPNVSLQNATRTLETFFRMKNSLWGRKQHLRLVNDFEKYYFLGEQLSMFILESRNGFCTLFSHISPRPMSFPILSRPRRKISRCEGEAESQKLMA